MAGFIVIELINIFETGNLINFFTRTEIKNLQSGTQKLLLFYAREPVSYRMIKESIDLLNKNGIENKNIVLVNGEFGSTILSEFPYDLTVIPYFWFDMTTAYNYTGRENISTKPTKKFLCYNNTVKLHRTLAYHALKPNKDGHISYLKRMYGKDIVQEEIDNSKLSANEKIIAQNISYSEPDHIDVTPDECAYNIFQDDYSLYDDTAFSIVTESLSTPGSLFITEKTFKAILSMHPFILFGSPGLLKFLKYRGYATYDFMIDDSYDEIEDIHQRLNAIVDIVNEFSWNTYKSSHGRISKIANYNKHRCLTTDYKKSLINLLRKVKVNENPSTGS
jgi:hypothetical protein